MTKADGEKFADHIVKNLSQVWTITSMHGKWDFALFLGVKTILEFHKIWDTIMLKFKRNIKHYNVAVYEPIHNFSRRFFIEDDVASVQRVYGGGEKEDIDTIDWKIIERYASHVRQSSLEIARMLKISPDTVRNRIRILEKKKVIVGYKIGLNLDRLGFVSYRVDIQLISTSRNKELFEFCKYHKNIYQVNKSIGGADFEIEVIVKDLNHLLEVIDEIKMKFKETVNDIDYFGFSRFHALKYIPD